MLPQHTMTEKQAITRAEEILHQTAAALKPRPRLETYRPGSITGPCLISPNDAKDKRVQVTRTFWLRGITPDQNAAIGTQILQYWKAQGYTITGSKGVGSPQPSISGATRADDFLISLDTSSDGSLSIGTTSPCIWAHGTPPAAG